MMLRTAGESRPSGLESAWPWTASLWLIAAWLPSAIASAAVGLAPLWWHLDLVDPAIDNITAVFGEVAVYPSDVCLAALAVLAITRPASLGGQVRWLAYGLTVLAGVALLSSLP